jgi:hypothetical protein
MNEKHRMLLEHYLKQLKLPAFKRDYEKIAELCAKNNENCI